MKALLRNAVLLFALGSVLWLGGQEWLARRSAGGGAPTTAQPPLGATTRLVVYYFSQGKECVTCDQIPAYAHEALEKHFAGELASGEIVWRTVDVDEPAQAHYIDQYNIFTKSIVLLRVVDGKEANAENLREVWELLGNKDAFVEYIRSSVARALEPTP